jgi:PAB-dependent poly(A)-specific ribonuclease subunit 2
MWLDLSVPPPQPPLSNLPNLSDKTDIWRPTGYVLDPLVKRWDIRNLRSLVPIPSYAPSSIRMHPKFTNTAIIVQRSGQFNLVDIDNTALNHLHHASMPSDSAALTKLAVSSSGEALAFADNEGLIQVWGRGTGEVQFSEYPGGIEWPNTPQDQVSAIDVNDPETPLSEVGMPYYTSELLSAWPTHMVFEVGHPTPRIDEKTLKGMARQDWYLYGRWNQPGRKRYQVDKVERAEEAPRFRSQVEKERAMGDDEPEKVVGRFEGGEGGVPNYYKKVEIKYSRFGVEDFDFGYPPKKAQN